MLILLGNQKPIFVNQAYADIFGYEAPEESRRMETMLPLLAPHERERLIHDREARMRGDTVPVQENGGRWSRMAIDGGEGRDAR